MKPIITKVSSARVRKLFGPPRSGSRTALLGVRKESEQFSSVDLVAPDDSGVLYPTLVIVS